MTEFLININSNQSVGDGSNTSDNFIVAFKNQIVLPQKFIWKCSLISCSIPYSWFNISTEIINNQFRYYSGKDSLWKIITLDDGNYTLSALSNEIFRLMIANGDYYQATTADDFEKVFEFLGNGSTNKVYVEFNSKITGYKIDWTYPSSFRELIGFNSIEQTASRNGDSFADMNRNINSIIVHCDLITGSFLDGYSGDGLITLYPDSAPFTRLILRPHYPVGLNVNTSSIKQISFRITDQSGRRVNLNGEPVNISLRLYA